MDFLQMIGTSTIEMARQTDPAFTHGGAVDYFVAAPYGAVAEMRVMYMCCEVV